MFQKKEHKEEKKQELSGKTKMVKARLINEDSELVFGLIEVPVEDKRPAFDPKTDTLASKNEARAGKGPE